MKKPGKINNRKYIILLSLIVLIVFFGVISLGYILDNAEPKPRLDIKINDAILTLPATSPAIASTTTAPDIINLDDYCEKSCITRTHYFSNGTKKLICVPLKDIGACGEIDD